LEKFIIQSSASGRKIIATCRIFVRKESALVSTYSKLCREFTDDRKAGLQNVRENVQVYIVPPQLKGSVSILRSIDGDDCSHTLYGIIVSREEGPSKYVHAVNDIVMEEELMQHSPQHDDEMEVDDGSGLEVPPNINLSVPLIPSSAPPQRFGPRPAMITTPRGLAVGPPHVTAPRPLATGGLSFQLSGPPRPMTSGGLALPIQPPRAIPGMNFPSAGLSLPRPGVLPTPMAMNLQPRTGLSLPGSGLSLQPRPAAPTASFDAQPSAKQRDIIRQIAQFCVDNGPETLAILKKKDTARTSTPFLFEGHPAYEEFQTALRLVQPRK
jgi:hypothetical protein